MSYCVQCGVELSDYHTECPLCHTKVVNPNSTEAVREKDYPDYRSLPVTGGKRANKIFTGIILSLLLFIYAIVPLFINLIVSRNITWSLYPLISVVLVWFGVAYPFFREKNSFFRLFTYDSLAVILYLLLLNFIISGNLLWARYACLSIIIVWVILSGIFIPEKIRAILPLTFYFILNAIIISVFFALFFDTELSIIRLLLPANVILFVLVILSYFIITSKVYDFLGLLMVLLSDITLFSISLDLLLTRFLQGSSSFTWSIIVVVATLPIIAIAHAIRKGKKIRSIVSKKLHR
ncbi:MAG: hypothetical protein JXQ23_11880 [Clostridia bacterium]|nr:hypothetical protein [Clostridia bacterium]